MSDKAQPFTAEHRVIHEKHFQVYEACGSTKPVPKAYHIRVMRCYEATVRQLEKGLAAVTAERERLGRTGKDLVRETCGRVTTGKGKCEGVVIVYRRNTPCNLNCPQCGGQVYVPAPPACHLCRWSVEHRDLDKPEYEDLYLCLHAPDLSDIENKIVTIRAVEIYHVCESYEDLGWKTSDMFSLGSPEKI